MTTRRAALALLAVAALGARSPRAAAVEGDPAVALIRGLYDGVKAATAAGVGTVASRLAAIQPTLEKTFDFPAMARLAVGSRWRNMQPAKQTVLLEAFIRFFMITYANRLSAAVGSRFEVQPASEARGQGRLVRTRVIDGQDRSTDVDYLLNATGKVGDIYLAGTVSEVGTMRSEFEAPLKSGGTDALEAYLKKRSDEMLAAKPGG